MFEWKKNVRKVTPYVPGEQPKETKVIKLNTNENPYPPAPAVEKLSKELDTGKMRLYPDPDSTILINAIADFHGVDADQVFVGVGSDDVLAMSFLTFFNSDKPILFPDITYSFYDVWADLFGIKYERPELNDDFTINIEDYMKANGGVVIANPNAPTSLFTETAELEKVVAANPDSVVIIDEAYVDFAKDSMLSYIDKYDNLLVVRTYSKSRSLAGLRIGYAIGNKELINALNSVKLSYNSYTMNMPSQIMGAAAIADNDYFEATVEKIIATREATSEKLKEMGFKVLPSSTNFLFVSHKDVPAEYIFEELRKDNIYVRYFKKPKINNFLRITIGTDEEMEIFLKKVLTTLK